MANGRGYSIWTVGDFTIENECYTNNCIPGCPVAILIAKITIRERLDWVRRLGLIIGITDGNMELGINDKYTTDNCGVLNIWVLNLSDVFHKMDSRCASLYYLSLHIGHLEKTITHNSLKDVEKNINLSQSIGISNEGIRLETTPGAVLPTLSEYLTTTLINFPVFFGDRFRYFYLMNFLWN